MGGEQAAAVLAMVRRDGIEARGEQLVGRGGARLQGADSRAVRAPGPPVLRERAAVGRRRHRPGRHARGPRRSRSPPRRCNAPIRRRRRRVPDVTASDRCSSKILIANRGEIACRVIRTARRLGIAHGRRVLRRRRERAATSGSPTRRCTSARRRRATLSRRRRDPRGRAGDRRRRRSIPGYGFLSENAAFAAPAREAGIVFVGPPADAIRAWARRAAAKALMAAAGVPVAARLPRRRPGSRRCSQREAARIGFPVLIKASAGGGGKGMRRVDAADDFAAALAVVPARGARARSATTACWSSST